MKIQYYFFVLIIVCSFSINSYSQSEMAVKLYDKVKTSIEEHQSMQAALDLKMLYPNDEFDELSGSFKQQNDRTKIDLGNLVFISDTVDSWTFIKDRNEVQINNIDKDVPSFTNPISILNYFFQESFEYEILDQNALIFKPGDRDAEFSKAHIQVDPALLLPTVVELFQKDGTRITMNITAYQLDKVIDINDLTFNKDDYPNLIIEDLRIK